MNRITQRTSLLILAVLILATVPFLGCPAQGLGQHTLLGRVRELENQVAALESKLAHVSVEEDPINGLNGPHLIIEGCNVHVRSGSGETDDSAGLTGLGNLLVGYNEPRSQVAHGRLGSHNLVIGAEHEYPNYGGFVTGFRNAVSGIYSSVSGGTMNEAGGTFSSVSGGGENLASGHRSSVGGGFSNEAFGSTSSIGAGNNGLASGTNSSINGGANNTAEGDYSSIGGGLQNNPTGEYSSVSGGYNNGADGKYSSVSGGSGNTAVADYSSVSGGSQNSASGNASSVSGGSNRSALDQYDWVAGALLQDN